MSQDELKAAAATLPVKANAPKLVKFEKPELKAYATVEDLASVFKSEGHRIQGETLRSGWMLGWHVKQILDKAAYGTASIEKLSELLGRGYSKSTLYTMAQFNESYEWKRVEKLIQNSVPLRAVQRLLSIADTKLRNELEDKLIDGELEADAITEEADKTLKKLVEPPPPAKAKKNEKPKTKDEQGGNSLMKATASAEAAGLVFITSLSDLSKALEEFDMVCKTDIRREGEKALAKFYDEVLADMPEQLSEINLELQSVSSKAAAAAKNVTPAKPAAPAKAPAKAAPIKKEAMEL